MATNNISTPAVTTTPTHGVHSKCVKCSEFASIVARIKDPMCRDCFDAYFVHKFRASLGKSRLFLNEERVLLAFSGGINSASLLSMVQRGLCESSHKRLQFSIDVIFIDEECLFGKTWPSDKILMIEHLSAMNFKLYILKIESYLHSVLKHCVETVGYLTVNSQWPVNTVNLEFEKNNLLKIFESLSNNTKQQLLEIIRHNLIARFAYEFGYKKILIGSNTTRLSTQLLSWLCCGKGAMISSDICFADDRFPGLVLCRPFREFLSKEVAFYVKTSNTKYFDFPNFDSIDRIENKKPTINHVTEDFLAELHSIHPFTTNTVFKTGGKLSPIIMAGFATCSLCMLGYNSYENNTHPNLCYSCQRIANSINPKSVSLIKLLYM